MQRLSGEWCAQARCSARAVSQFFNELSTMLGTGIAIDQGLSILSEYAAEDTVAVVAHDLQSRVSSGQMISAAMSAFPRIFSPLAVAVLRMGERSGQLAAQMQVLSRWYQRDDRLRQQMGAALTYPLITLGFCLVIVVAGPAVLFRGLFQMLQQADMQLPWITRALIGFSNATLNPLAWLALAGGLFMGWRLYFWLVPPERARLRHDRWLRGLYVLGPLMQMQALLRFARALGVVATSGMALHDGLTLAAACTGSPGFELAVAGARQRVIEGEPLSRALAETGLFPKLFTLTLTAAEETGDMANSLRHLSEIYELELECRVEAASGAMGPIVTVLVGGMVGLLNLATLLPIMRFLEKL